MLDIRGAGQDTPQGVEPLGEPGMDPAAGLPSRRLNGPDDAVSERGSPQRATPKTTSLADVPLERSPKEVLRVPVTIYSCIFGWL